MFCSQKAIVTFGNCDENNYRMIKIKILDFSERTDLYEHYLKKQLLPHPRLRWLPVPAAALDANFASIVVTTW